MDPTLSAVRMKQLRAYPPPTLSARAVPSECGPVPVLKSKQSTEEARPTALAQRAPTDAGQSVYSAAELAAMFVRPTLRAQLIENLKVAVDRHLLVEPAFFDDLSLLKFVNASAVKWDEQDTMDRRRRREEGTLSFADGLFPTMTGLVRRSVYTTESNDHDTGLPEPPGASKRSGYVSLQIDGPPRMTVCDVVEIFGPPHEVIPDTGDAAHGASVIPTSAGKLTDDYSRDQNGGAILTHHTIEFVLAKTPARRRPPEWRRGLIACREDTVQSISMFQTERK